FDRAQIATIHGFCMRTLACYGLESGVPAETKLIEGADDLLREVVDDVWVAALFDAGPVLHHALRADGVTLEAARQLAQAAVGRREASLVPPDPGLGAPDLGAYDRARDAVAALWPAQARAAR